MSHAGSTNINIVIADDHAVFRQGLRALLEEQLDWKVVAEAASGLEVIPLVQELAPDILVIDLTMPSLGGIEAIARLRKDGACPGILVLSGREDEESVGSAMRAGANAYVPKSAAMEELAFAIRAVLKGQRYLSPVVCDRVLASGMLSGKDQAQSPLQHLTAREREVLKLLAEGTPNREVAKILHISPRTIDSHRANIMKKLGAKSNAELVQIAMRYGLIE